MKKLKRTILLATSFVLALVIVSCGGSGELSLEQNSSIGQPFPLQFKNKQLELSIETADQQQNYLIVFYNGKDKGADGYLQIESNLASAAATEKNDNKRIALGTDYKSFLLNSGQQLLKAGLSPASPSPFNSKATGAPAEQRSFKMLNNFSNLTEYTTFPAKLISASSKSYFYADLRGDTAWHSEPALKPAITELQQLFDEHILANNHQLFGDESDIDNCKAIYVIISDELNQLGTGYQGILRGFFFSGDLLAFDPELNPASNEKEIIYLAAPQFYSHYSEEDRADKINYTVGKIMPSTLAHELQHLINFNQRVLLRGYDNEEVWLNEGLSHLAEDLNGFGLDNDGRAVNYLLQTDKTSLTSGRDSLPQRGGNYLLLRQLINSQQRPITEITRQLVSGKNPGVEKFKNIFNKDYSDILADFSLSLWFDSENSGDNPLYTIGPQTIFQANLQFFNQKNRLQHFAKPTVLPLVNGRHQILPSELSYFYFAAEKNKTIQLTLKALENISPGGYLIRLADGKDGRLID